jgi:TPR repeat protein
MAPGQEEAARRYREGEALERKGDDAGALKAYLDAGEAGHGLAQRRLGQIYDKGNTAVQRDYQASLKWYQKAREQGVEIDKPLPRMTTK